MASSSSARTTAASPDAPYTSGSRKHKGARGFISHGPEKCPNLRTHYHFEIVFSPDNRSVRKHFMDELMAAYQLGDDLIFIECPEREYLLSIPNKLENTAAVEFLKSTEQLRLGNIYFTSKSADEEPTFCGTPGYDSHDHHAASEILVELGDLPLHLWTFKTVDHILHPYCVIAEIHPKTAAFDDLLAFTCICWTDTPLNVPSKIIVKVRRRNRNAASMLEGIHLDVFTVSIRVINNPFNKKLWSVELLPPLPTFRRSNMTAVPPHCFLAGTEVEPERLEVLMQSLLLTQDDCSQPIEEHAIFFALHELMPAARLLQVRQINSDTFIVYCHGNAAFAHFRSNAIRGRRVELGGQIFTATPWCPSYRAEEGSLTRFVRVTLSGRPIQLLQQEIASQLLSSFVLVEIDTMPNQVLMTEDKYSCLGWVDSVIDIPDYINIYVTSRRCQPDHLHTGQHYMSLYIRYAVVTIEPAYMLQG